LSYSKKGYSHDCRNCRWYQHHEYRSEGEPQTNTCDKDPVPDLEHWCELRKEYIDSDVIPYLKRNFALSYEKVWDKGTKIHGVPLKNEDGEPQLDSEGMPVLEPDSIWYEEARDWLLPEVRFEKVLRALIDKASWCEFYIKKFL